MTCYLSVMAGPSAALHPQQVMGPLLVTGPCGLARCSTALNTTYVAPQTTAQHMALAAQRRSWPLEWRRVGQLLQGQQVFHRVGQQHQQRQRIQRTRDVPVGVALSWLRQLLLQAGQGTADASSTTPSSGEVDNSRTNPGGCRLAKEPVARWLSYLESHTLDLNGWWHTSFAKRLFLVL